MKLQIFAIILLLSAICAVCINSVVLSGILDELTGLAASIPDEPSAYCEYIELSRLFMEKQKFISLTVSHEDLTEIESTLAEIIGSAEAGDGENLKIAKSRLIQALTHLRRLTGINIDSIL